MCFFIHSLCYCQEDAERLRKDMKAIHKQFGFKIDSCAQNAYDNTDLEKLIFPLYSSNEQKVYKFYIQDCCGMSETNPDAFVMSYFHNRMKAYPIGSIENKFSLLSDILNSSKEYSDDAHRAYSYCDSLIISYDWNYSSKNINDSVVYVEDIRQYLHADGKIKTKAQEELYNVLYSAFEKNYSNKLSKVYGHSSTEQISDINLINKHKYHYWTIYTGQDCENIKLIQFKEKSKSIYMTRISTRGKILYIRIGYLSCVALKKKLQELNCNSFSSYKMEKCVNDVMRILLPKFSKN